MVERGYFTQEAAEAKLGCGTRTRVAGSGVPEGATGTVVRADPMGGGWDVGIQWDLPTGPMTVTSLEIKGEPVTYIQGGKPLVDWFSKDEYEEYLEELESVR
jgi:hypothetical protein